MKALPRDAVGFHKRAVRRARDSEERAVAGGRGFGLGESGTDANGVRWTELTQTDYIEDMYAAFKQHAYPPAGFT